jgi:hypothetical protein
LDRRGDRGEVAPQTSPAALKLEAIAADLRKAEPTLTKEMAYTKSAH